MGTKKNIVAGIYKITSPSGKIYIGQSWNIDARWNEYRTKKAPYQRALNNSFLKYGVNAHHFALVWGFPKPTQELLDGAETMYIRFNKQAGKGMLNIKEGGKGGKNSPETIEKMKIASTGRKHSEETKKLMATYRKGTKFPDEWRKNIALGQIGRISPKGIDSGVSKLKESDILTIRASNKRKIDLAAEFDISLSHLHRIITRQNWKHI